MDFSNASSLADGCTVLKIDQYGNSPALTIDGQSGGGILTANAFEVLADDLSTGGLAYLYSNSPRTNARNLVHIINENTLATSAVPLWIRQDAITYAMYIDHPAISGESIHIAGGQTSGANVHIQIHAIVPTPERWLL